MSFLVGKTVFVTYLILFWEEKHDLVQLKLSKEMNLIKLTGAVYIFELFIYLCFMIMIKRKYLEEWKISSPKEKH